MNGRGRIVLDISVIVLIYNMEALLPRCLDSLERQTKHGIQFVLVDDGSTDNSGRICDEWHPKNHFVKVIHKENGGVVAGWMDGVNASDGKYVGFVDSDDYIDDDMYDTLWRPVAEHQVDISMCNHLYERDGNLNPCESLLADGLYVGNELKKLHSLIMPKLAEKYLSPSLCNKILKKELFQRNFEFCDVRATIADDVSIVIPTLFASKSFWYQNKPLYHYVVRGNSVTNTYKENMYFQHELLIDNLKRAVNYYQPELNEGTFDMFISAMGNQWLRMICKSNIARAQRLNLLKNFYSDPRYVLAAKNICGQTSNKWVNAYCNVVLKRRHLKYLTMIRLLQLRNYLIGD